MAGHPIPLPSPQGESRFYWDAARRGELWLRRCNGCGDAYFYPRDISPCCFSRDTEWMRASGRATLFSFAIVHRSPHPAFQDRAPFVVAIAELEEGPLMATDLVGLPAEPDPADLRIGMDLVVTFDDVSEEVTLPRFRPA